MSFLQRSPLRRVPPQESTPGCPGPTRCHPYELVPSMPFFPTTTVCSSHGIAGLSHPASDHGVRLVSSRPPTLPPNFRPSSQAHFLALRSFSLRCRREAVTTPQDVFTDPVAPHAVRPDWRTSRAPDHRGLTRCRVRCLPATLLPRLGPMLPWASLDPGSHPPTVSSRLPAAETTSCPTPKCLHDAMAFPPDLLRDRIVTTGTTASFRRAARLMPPA